MQLQYKKQIWAKKIWLHIIYIIFWITSSITRNLKKGLQHALVTEMSLRMKQLTYKAVIRMYIVVRTELANLPYRQITPLWTGLLLSLKLSNMMKMDSLVFNMNYLISKPNRCIVKRIILPDHSNTCPNTHPLIVWYQTQSPFSHSRRLCLFSLIQFVLLCTAQSLFSTRTQVLIWSGTDLI